MTLVNKDNSHIGGMLSSNQGGVRGTGGKLVSGGKCVGIKHYGGKKKTRHRRKKRRVSRKVKKSRKSRKVRKSRKSRKSYSKGKKRSKMRRRTRKRGGAVMEPHSPLTGLKSILTRGGNASRGLSASEKRTLKEDIQKIILKNITLIHYLVVV